MTRSLTFFLFLLSTALFLLLIDAQLVAYNQNLSMKGIRQCVMPVSPRQLTIATISLDSSGNLSVSCEHRLSKLFLTTAERKTSKP